MSVVYRIDIMFFLYRAAMNDFKILFFTWVRHLGNRCRTSCSAIEHFLRPAFSCIKSFAKNRSYFPFIKSTTSDKAGGGHGNKHTAWTIWCLWLTIKLSWYNVHCIKTNLLFPFVHEAPGYGVCDATILCFRCCGFWFWSIRQRLSEKILTPRVNIQPEN